MEINGSCVHVLASKDFPDYFPMAMTNTQTYLRFDPGHPVWIRILEESNLKETERSVMRKKKKKRFNEENTDQNGRKVTNWSGSTIFTILLCPDERLWNYRVQIR